MHVALTRMNGIYVTNARGGESATGSQRGYGAGGGIKCAGRLVGARTRPMLNELPVGTVPSLSVYDDRKMDEPWCLVASEATGMPTPVLIAGYYFWFSRTLGDCARRAFADINGIMPLPAMAVLSLDARFAPGPAE